MTLDNPGEGGGDKLVTASNVPKDLTRLDGPWEVSETEGRLDRSSKLMIDGCREARQNRIFVLYRKKD